MKSAKPDTWMPLVIGDYLKDTTRLTTEQHGAYLLLIMSYWIEGAPLDDDEELASITGLDRKSWAKHRAKIERFFRVENGRWYHKRIEEELERWAIKKKAYAERAAAGGRAKAAKSSGQARNKHEKTHEKSCLNPAPQPASSEVEYPSGNSTLRGEMAFAGPREVREAFRDALGEEWARSYIDPCGWQDVPERALLPPTKFAGAKIVGEGRKVLAALRLTVIAERAA